MLSKQIKYHTVQKIVAETKNIFTNSNIKEDDCRCTKCKNLELMLITSLHSLRKSKQDDLAAKLKTDADSFMESIVCSIMNEECCAETCPTSLENDDLNETFPILSEIEEVTYSQWTWGNKCCFKK